MGSKDLADGSVSYRRNKKKGVADRLKDILGLNRSPGLTTLDDERFERTPEPQANFWKNIPKKRETFTLDDFKDLKIEELPKAEVREHEWVRIEETENAEIEVSEMRSEEVHAEDTVQHVPETEYEHVIEVLQDESTSSPVEAAVESQKQTDEPIIDDYFDFLPPMKDAVRRPAGSRIVQKTPTVEIRPKTVFDFDDPISSGSGATRSHIKIDATIDQVVFEETPVHAAAESEPAVEAETTMETLEQEIAVTTELSAEPIIDAEPTIEDMIVANDIMVEESAEQIIEEAVSDVEVAAEIEETMPTQGRYVNVELNLEAVDEEVAAYVPNFILVDSDKDNSMEAAIEQRTSEPEIEPMDAAPEKEDVPMSAEDIVEVFEEEESLDTVLPYEALRAFDSEEDVPEVELDIGLTDVEDDYIEIVVDEEDRITTVEPKIEAMAEAEDEITDSGVMFDFFSPSAEMTDPRISMTFGVEASGIKIQEQPVVEMKEENVIYL